MTFKKLVKALKHFDEFGLAGFHESFDFVVFKSMTCDEPVELMAVIFYCRQVTIHLPVFVLLAPFGHPNLIEESVPKECSLLDVVIDGILFVRLPLVQSLTHI